MKTTQAQRLAAKRWRLKHPDRFKATQRRQYERISSDPGLLEKRRRSFRRWYLSHREQAIECNRSYRRNNPNAEAADRLRGKLRYAVKAGLTSSVEPLMGCTIKELRAHLEAQWTAGMSWANYGRYWTIDHIKPFAAVDLSDPAQLEEVMHYSNMRPLTRFANQVKHARPA